MPLSDRDDESSESADKHEIRQDNASTAVLKEITAAGGNNSESLLSTADDNDNDDDDGSDDFFSDEESMEVYKTGRPNRLDTQGLRQIITRHDARFEECLQHGQFYLVLTSPTQALNTCCSYPICIPNYVLFL